MLKRSWLVLALALILSCLGMAQEAAVPELTPAQKGVDFRYLTALVRDEWPFAEYNVRYKGLDDLNALADAYITRAKASTGDEEYYAVFREYLQRLQQTGHAYVLEPGVASGYDQPLVRSFFDLTDKPFARSDYWWGMERKILARRWAHSLLDVWYRDGDYVLRTDYNLGRKKLPTGTIVRKVDGVDVDRYVLSLQARQWLPFDAKRGKVFRPELFADDPGVGVFGWRVEFELPDGTRHTESIYRYSGPLQISADRQYPNAHCVELNPQTGFIKITSFGAEHIAEDAEVIQAFMRKSGGRYKKLIIDIRCNGGGSPAYYMDDLIAPLLKAPLDFTEIAALRRPFAERMRDKLALYMEMRGEMLSPEFHCLSWRELPSAPGLSGEDWRIFEITRRIEPKGSFPFTGQVYLLTDPYSFSASDNFAGLVKRTGIARIVGTNPSGSSAYFVATTLFALPESGIFFRLEMELALNPDGKPNEIYGTEPDVWLPLEPPATGYERESLLRDPWVQWVLGDR